MEKSEFSPEISSPNGLRKEQGTRIRKTVGVTINTEVLVEARKRGLNISRITEEALTRKLEDSSATKTHLLESKVVVPPTDMEAAVTRVPVKDDLDKGRKTELEPEAMAFATRVQENSEEASAAVPDQNSNSSAAHDPETRVKVSPIDHLALALSTVMEPCDLCEESGHLVIKAKRQLTEDEYLHVLEIVIALGGHFRKGSKFEWEIGPVPDDKNKAKNDFEESFGSLAAFLDFKKFETYVEVRPKRKWEELDDFLRAYEIVVKHGGDYAGNCNVGAYFRVPLAHQEE